MHCHSDKIEEVLQRWNKAEIATTYRQRWIAFELGRSPGSSHAHTPLYLANKTFEWAPNMNKLGTNGCDVSQTKSLNKVINKQRSYVPQNCTIVFHKLFFFTKFHSIQKQSNQKSCSIRMRGLTRPPQYLTKRSTMIGSWR